MSVTAYILGNAGTVSGLVGQTASFSSQNNPLGTISGAGSASVGWATRCPRGSMLC